MEQFFIFLSFTIIFSAIMTITSINPIHSVFWLVIVFINSAGLLISLKFEFISLMLIIIYVGAIAILFLFVIMMLDILQLKKIGFINHIIPIVIITGVNIIFQIWWLLEDNSLIFSWSILIKEWDFESLNHISVLGLLLYTEYAYPFIILSMLLLVAMIGAIVLTLELGVITRRQSLTDQHHRNNSWI
uniref:NADH-ubiquinone oxidoreductase chain 6 n=1 Tax=Staurostoma mertensii TaxID=1804149 RepID=A0A0S2IB07_9CNID|nr:NADH dehydrogenase subunit 6 [Staurostoma mertensii]